MQIYWLILAAVLIIYYPLRKHRNIYVAFSFTLMAIVGALRSNLVGADTAMYEFIFSNNMLVKSNVGYQTFSSLVRSISSDPHTITSVSSIVICILFAIFVMRIDVNAFLATFLFITMFFWGTSLNSSRQFLAMGVIVNAALYLFEKKWIKAAILAFVAVSIHSTAVILLVLVPIYFLKRNKLSLIIFSGIMLLFIPLHNTVVNIFVQYFPDYEMYLDGTNTLQTGTAGAGGAILYNFFIFAVFILLIALIIQKKIPLSRPELGFTYAFAVYAFLDLLFSNQVILQRVFMYFSMFGIFVLPMLLVKVSTVSNRSTRLVLNLVFIVFMAFYYYIQLSHDYINIVPYVLN